MNTKAMSQATSIQRRAGSNSMASNRRARPSSHSRLPRCRSPWPSRTRPAARRAAISGARRRPSVSLQCASRCSVPASAVPAPSAARGAKLSCASRARSAAWPQGLSAGACAAWAWKVATARARASIWAGPRAPRAARSASRAPGGKRRMCTAHSIACAASPPRRGAAGVPVIGSTSRYSSGALRRLMRSSSSQAARRCARVPKSRKSSVSGFLIL